MGMGEEWEADHAYEIFNSRYEEIQEELSECTDDELISNAISVGAELDNFEHFPAYSVAQKIKYNRWKLTRRQRDAFINCLAYYLNEQERDGL